MPLIALRCSGFSSRKAEVVMKSPKSAPTKRVSRPSDSLTKDYLDLKKLREEVRRAEKSFGVRIQNLKGGTRSEQRSN
jgi:hypothetical protein